MPLPSEGHGGCCAWWDDQEAAERERRRLIRLIFGDRVVPASMVVIRRELPRTSDVDLDRSPATDRRDLEDSPSLGRLSRLLLVPHAPYLRRQPRRFGLLLLLPLDVNRDGPDEAK